MRMPLAAALRLLTLILLIASGALSQTAQLTGTITDSSGSLIPRARVVATNVDTAVARESVTNDSGNYLITGLLPGTIALTAEKAGFKQSISIG